MQQWRLDSDNWINWMTIEPLECCQYKRPQIALFLKHQGTNNIIIEKQYLKCATPADQRAREKEVLWFPNKTRCLGWKIRNIINLCLFPRETTFSRALRKNICKNAILKMCIKRNLHFFKIIIIHTTHYGSYFWK